MTAGTAPPLESMELDLVFDIERVTSEAMKRWNIDSAPDSLRDTSRWG